MLMRLLIVGFFTLVLQACGGGSESGESFEVAEVDVFVGDADGDGVRDDTDQCADTPTGEAVDALGCAAAQRDTDGDGVNDALDQCPDTAAGAPVDAAGCALGPPAAAPVITTSGSEILDATGVPFMARGVNLQYGDNPGIRLGGIDPIAAVGANIVRLQLRRNTTAQQLRDAMEEIVENDMVAMPFLWETDITCSNDASVLLNDVDNLWLGEWLPVLAEARYQPYLMINVANEWGPFSVTDLDNGYDEYFATYATIIGRFRAAGFKVPLVIDAPHCGQDFQAFTGGRSQALLDADVETNIVLSVHPYNFRWNSIQEMDDALAALVDTGMPFVAGEFGDLDHEASSGNQIDHFHLMEVARTDAALSFDLPWGDGADKLLWRRQLDAAVDLTGKVVRADIYMPQAYVDDGNLGVKVFTKDTAWAYGSLGWNSAGAMTGDTWNTIEIPVTDIGAFDFTAAGFDMTQVDKIGIELIANGKPAAVTGAILVDNIEIADPATPALNDQFAADISNWEYDWSEGALTMANVGVSHSMAQGSGAMAFDIPWGDAAADKLLYRRVNLPAAVDLTGITVRADIYIPQAYVDDGNMGIKLFTKDTAWVYGSLGWNSTGDLQGDAWNTIAIDDISAASFDFTADGFDMTQVDKVGVEFVSNGKPTAVTGIIHVDNVVVTAADTTLHSDDFNGSIGGWEYDWAEGSLTQQSVEAAGVVSQSAAQGSPGFGWIAWSWKGNGAGAITLDMSNSENSVDLTERGEDIANSTNGLVNTSELANFPQ